MHINKMYFILMTCTCWFVI